MKVGEYVRTKCGIAKIKKFELLNKEVMNLDKDIMIYNMDCYRNCCIINQVLKSSPNIIDLIETGDYVNGNKVWSVYNDLIYCNEDAYEDYCIKYTKEDIKSIVTKEQFESMKYKIGE